MGRAQEIQDYGKVENHFRLLADDMQTLDAQRFLDFVLPSKKSRTELATQLGVERTNLYRKKLPLSNQQIHERLVPFVIAGDLAVQLFKDDGKARAWLMQPNAYLFGESPFEVSIRGEGKQVIRMLLEWLGRIDGQAF